jgi:hypothetical protein
MHLDFWMPACFPDRAETFCAFRGMAIAVFIFLPGCGKTRTDAEFVPSVQQSDVALKAVLEGWKAGQPSGPVPGTSPQVHVTDSSRVPGQVLEDYQILGEVPGNAPRCLAVRLKLANPGEERRERYVVVGIDPLWVFRHADYDLLLHWEHKMEKDPATSGPESQPITNAAEADAVQDDPGSKDKAPVLP